MAVFLGMAALAVLLLLWPVAFHVSCFDGKAQLSIRYLFLHLRFPGIAAKEEQGRAKRRGRQKGKKDAPPAPAGETKKEEVKLPSIRAQEIVEWIQRGIAALGKSAGMLLRGVRVREVKLEIRVVRENAHQTAVAAGKLNALVGAGAALVQGFTRIGYLYLNIYPGFWTPKEELAFAAAFWVRPGRVLMAAVVLLVKGIPVLFDFLRSVQNKEESPVKQK